MIYYEEVRELPIFDLKTEFENLNLDWLKSADPFGGDQICVMGTRFFINQDLMTKQ